MSHLSGEVKRLLGLITRYDQDNYPEMLGHVCVINAPYIFQVIWKVVKTMLDPRTQHKIEVRARCVCGGGLRLVLPRGKACGWGARGGARA